MRVEVQVELIASDRPASVQARSSTVAGGEQNTADAWAATVSGGYLNNASDRAATASGGVSNTVDGDAATIGGGELNRALGNWATIAGGQDNRAGQDYTSVAGGYSNKARGDYASVGGGYGNRAIGDFAVVPGGWHAVASHHGEMAHASGSFSNTGDAQVSLYVLRNTTGDATQTELFLNGLDQRLTIEVSRTVTFDLLVVAASDGGLSAGCTSQGVIENVVGNTGFVGTPTVSELGEDNDWTVAAEADDANEALAIMVTGESATNIRWVATVRTVEVAW